MIKTVPYRIFPLLACALFFCSLPGVGSTSPTKDNLSKMLLGKDVRARLDMPAYKDGLDIYITPKEDKRFDDRGIDLKELTRWLKQKGVGVERDEWVTITDVKIDSDRIEIHLGGGGQGSGASKNANKKGAGFKRAGGSRINFRYGRDLTDADIQQGAFLDFLSRVVDVSRIQESLALQALPQEVKTAMINKKIEVGMDYQTVRLVLGDPEQKKIDESTDESLRETWFYLLNGKRMVIKFQNGNVVSVKSYD